MVSVILIILSFGMLIMTYIFWKGIRPFFKCRLVADLIFFFIFLKLSLYYLMPTVLRIISDYRYLEYDGVEPIELIYVYGIEFISWMFWLPTLYFIVKIFGNRFRQPMIVSNYMNYNYRTSTQLLYILTFGFIAIMVSRFFFDYSSFYLNIFQTLFYSTGLIAGPFLFVVSLKFFNKKLFYLGMAATIVSLIFIHTRGVLVYETFFLFFLVFFVLKSNKLKRLSVFLLIALLGFHFIFSGLPRIAVTLVGGETSIESTVNTKKLEGRTPYDDIEWRFGAQTRMGVAFIRLYDRGEDAGINPIKNSFLGFLPRSLNPNKPHPSTLDGDDIYSQGMYIVSREIRGYYDDLGRRSFNMVEFPTGGHFYWEYGLFGVVVLSIISAVYIGFTSVFFSRLGPVSIPLIVSTFKPWGFNDPKIWVSEAILQIYQLVLPLLLLLFILKSFYLISAIMKNFLLASSRSKSSLKIKVQ